MAKVKCFLRQTEIYLILLIAFSDRCVSALVRQEYACSDQVIMKGMVISDWSFLKNAGDSKSL